MFVWLRQKDREYLRDEERFRTTGGNFWVFFFFFICFLTKFPDQRELQKKSDSEAAPSPSLRSVSVSWRSVEELVAKPCFQKELNGGTESLSIHYQAKRSQINDHCQSSRGSRQEKRGQMGLAWDPGLQGQMGTNDTERGWKPPSVMQMGLRPGDQILEMRVPLPQAIPPSPSPPPRPCVSSQCPPPPFWWQSSQGLKQMKMESFG